MTESYLSLLLIFLLVAQQGAWMWYSQKLVDKAKSQSHYEYLQAETQGLKKYKDPMGEELIPIHIPKDHGNTKADRLNQMMGLG